MNSPKAVLIFNISVLIIWKNKFFFNIMVKPITYAVSTNGKSSALPATVQIIIF